MQEYGNLVSLKARMTEAINPDLITALTDEFPLTRRIVVAFSGGLDSRVLLHLAACSKTQHNTSVIAVHIDHGLQDASREWALNCESVCEQARIPLTVLEARITPKVGQSVEAVAREKRYALIYSQLVRDDILLLAQHADDQVETLLLQLLRGAGPSGLASMAKVRFQDGFRIIRPLLGFNRLQLQNYAWEHKLNWIADPSNQDCRFDRNYLRKQIIPLLKQRFPSLEKTFARSAAHCAESVGLIEQLSNDAFKKLIGKEPGQLNLNVLKQYSEALQKHLLRSWIKYNGYRAPQARHMQQIQGDLISDNIGYEAVVSNSEYEMRKYRDILYIGEKTRNIDAFSYLWAPSQPSLFIEPLGITITRESLNQDAGICLPDQSVLNVKSRLGGEKTRFDKSSPSKSLKKVFQEKNIPPWQRQNYYLIFFNAELIAVPDLFVQKKYQRQQAAKLT